MRLGYVDSFRAVAMTIVVGGHAFVAFSWAASPFTDAVLRDVLDNGTVLFVFLAGFLFEHRAYVHNYPTYLSRRFARLLLPYLVMSVPLVTWDVLFSDAEAKFPEQLDGTSSLYQVTWLLLRGSVVINYALWFVPMMTLFYLATPAFAYVVRHPRLYVLLVGLIPLSLLMHRVSELETVWMAIYFLPAYVAGMWASHIRLQLEPFLLRSWPWLAGLFVLGTAAMVLLGSHHGNYAGSAPFSQEHGLVDWLFAQKLLLCFALLGLMLRLQPRVGASLRHLADLSPTVFFLHLYVLYLFALAERRWSHPWIGNVGAWLALTTATIALIAVGAVCARRVLGRSSRYVIGS